LKVLVKMGRFSGGAPLSALEYIKILKKYGYDISVEAVRHNEEIEKKFINEGIPIKFTENLDIITRKFQFATLKEYLLETRENILMNKIDLIISVGDGRLVYFLSHLSTTLKKKYIGVIAGGNSKVVQNSKHWKADKIVCFSGENKADIIKEGFPKEKILVLSNRISVEKDPTYLEHYEEINQVKPLNFLLTSRIDNNKINSIKSTIDLVKKLNENQLNVVLKIAGDGEKFREIKNIAETVNSEIGQEIIILLGHISEMREYFLEAHVVLGKGRSVIEPIMMNRIGIIINEESKFSLYNSESAENLYYFNFSGRNISRESSEKHIFELVRNLQMKKIDLKKYFESNNYIIKRYHSDYLEENFINILNEVTVRKSNNFNVKKLKFEQFLLNFYISKYYIFNVKIFLKRNFKFKKL